MVLETICARVSAGNYLAKSHLVQHALKEGFERKHVVEAILNGTIIEEYPDGHLSLPDEVLEKLGLNPPCSVKVTLTVETALPSDEQNGWEVFRRLGRDATDGKLENTSTKHDQYLYGNKA